MDIAGYPNGCAILASDDDNRLFLKGISNEGKVLFSRNIINNGRDPTKVREQCSFFDNKGEPWFGTSIMFNPDNGKLLYANYRFIADFSHYNCFKVQPRDCHTGNAMMSFDINGKDEKAAWMWGASHCVLNTIMFDGSKIMSAELGDAYPVNIVLASNDTVKTNGDIDGKAKKEMTLKSKRMGKAVEGFIPGNHAGATAGRIGSIVEMNGLYYLPYSRVPEKFI